MNLVKIGLIWSERLQRRTGKGGLKISRMTTQAEKEERGIIPPTINTLLIPSAVNMTKTSKKMSNFSNLIHYLIETFLWRPLVSTHNRFFTVLQLLCSL